MIKSQLYSDIFNRLSSELIFLEDKPAENPESSLKTLWHLAAGFPMSVELASETELPEINTEEVTQLRELVEQRISGIPLAQLTNRQRFMELDFFINSDIFIPRKETEPLVKLSMDILHEMSETRDNIIVIDLCSGSGNLGLALAYYEEKVHVYGSDISNDAVVLSQKNAQLLELSKRTDYREGDFFAPFDSENLSGKVDMIICNPPYISSGKVATMPKEIVEFESILAFDGGPFGVKIINRLIKESPSFLRKGGWLCFELGIGQGAAIIKRIEKSGNYSEVKSVMDHNNEIRGILTRV